jgi:hypothetical protein
MNVALFFIMLEPWCLKEDFPQLMRTVSVGALAAGPVGPRVYPQGLHGSSLRTPNALYSSAVLRNRDNLMLFGAREHCDVIL